MNCQNFNTGKKFTVFLVLTNLLHRTISILTYNKKGKRYVSRDNKENIVKLRKNFCKSFIIN